MNNLEEGGWRVAIDRARGGEGREGVIAINSSNGGHHAVRKTRGRQQKAERNCTTPAQKQMRHYSKKIKAEIYRDIKGGGGGGGGKGLTIDTADSPETVYFYIYFLRLRV